MAGDGVMIHPYTTTFEGSSITFTCEDGFVPSDIITATCTGEGHWSTDPATYMCINTISTTTTTTINNTDAVNCFVTCSTNPTTSQNPEKGTSNSTCRHFLAVLAIDTVNIDIIVATLCTVRFNSDSDHWCPDLHCWIGWWVCRWCSSCVLLWQVAE